MDFFVQSVLILSFCSMFQAGARTDTGPCTASPTRPIALEKTNPQLRSDSNHPTATSLEKASNATKQQSAPDRRVLGEREQAAAPPRRTQEEAADRVEEVEGVEEVEEMEEVEGVAASEDFDSSGGGGGGGQEELSKFDEVAASESLLMLSGAGGAGGDLILVSHSPTSLDISLFFPFFNLIANLL